MYDLSDHRSMVSDEVRIAAYARAIREVVRPDDVVLDLGCGIGILSVLAARAGARRVYAVDPTDSVHYARRVVVENQVADRVVVVRGRIEDVTLPERPTLIVGDVRGPLPLDAGGASAWEAARRILAPNGRTIPRKDVVYAQPISSRDLHGQVHAFGPVAGVSFDALRTPLANTRHEEPADAVPLAGEMPLFEIVYGAPPPARYEGTAEFVALHAGSVDAFRVGFEADLAPGISYRSFGPGRARAYGVHVLSTPRRIDLAAGTRLSLRVVADVVDTTTQVTWAVDVDGTDGAWQGALVEAAQSLDVVRAGLSDHVPGADPADDLDAVILAEFRKGKTIGDATAAAMGAMPAVPPERVEIRVVELSRRRQGRVVRRIGGA